MWKTWVIAVDNYRTTTPFQQNRRVLVGIDVKYDTFDGSILGGEANSGAVGDYGKTAQQNTQGEPHFENITYIYVQLDGCWVK